VRARRETESAVVVIEEHDRQRMCVCDRARVPALSQSLARREKAPQTNGTCARPTTCTFNFPCPRDCVSVRCRLTEATGQESAPLIQAPVLQALGTGRHTHTHAQAISGRKERQLTGNPPGRPETAVQGPQMGPETNTGPSMSMSMSLSMGMGLREPPAAGPPYWPPGAKGHHWASTGLSNIRPSTSIAPGTRPLLGAPSGRPAGIFSPAICPNRRPVR